MKKSIWMILAAAVFLPVACSRNEDADITAPAKETVWTYISALGGENGTKASTDGNTGAFSWNTGDQIAMYSGSTYYKSASLSSTYNTEASATFAFAGEIEAGRTDFAVFPASLVFDGDDVRTSSASNHDADNLTITLPASYTLEQVLDNVAPTPMIAANVKGQGLAFKSICPLLRVTVNNVPKQTRRIEFDFNGKKVQGEFTLTGVEAGTTKVETSATDNTDDIITILTPDITTFGNLVINLPIPAGVTSIGEYTDITITSYDAASGGHKINAITTAIRADGNWVPGRKSARKLAATLPVFTAATGKKVVFAPGNLQAVLEKANVPTSSNPIGTASSWQFAEHQYSIIGDTSVNKFYTNSSGAIDLFSWVGNSADNNSYGILFVTSYDAAYHGNVNNESLKSDWGQNIISDAGGDYPAGTWYTPTNSHWAYIFNTRTVASSFNAEIENARFIKAKVGDNPGIILFPDNYVHPAGLSKPSSINMTGAESGGPTVAYTVNTISLANWEKMERAGCVFLPCVGYRAYGTSSYYIANRVGQADENACYWSSTGTMKDSQYFAAWGLYFNSSKGWVSSNGGLRQQGRSVRLIRDVN